GGRVAAEEPRRRELAELVAHHVLGDVHGDELVPVMHRERVADELGQHRARARPGLDHALLVARVHRLDALRQRFLNEWTFLYASTHDSNPGWLVAGGWLLVIFNALITDHQ